MNDFVYGSSPLDDSMRYVTLYDITGPVIIVPSNTSIIYTNQTDGCACNHPELEGYLIIPEVKHPLHLPLNPKIFDPDWWYLQSMDDQKILEIEDMLNVPCSQVRNLKVLKDRRMEEAWVWVEFDYRPWYNEEAEKLQGILTWPNSD